LKIWGSFSSVCMNFFWRMKFFSILCFWIWFVLFKESRWRNFIFRALNKLLKFTIKLAFLKHIFLSFSNSINHLLFIWNFMRISQFFSQIYECMKAFKLTANTWQFKFIELKLQLCMNITIYQGQLFAVNVNLYCLSCYFQNLDELVQIIIKIIWIVF
jgi:hypothetical protein